MRNNFDHVSSRKSPNVISCIEVTSLFKNSDYGQGFFDRQCEFVEAMIKASGMTLEMDEPNTGMKMNVLLEGKAIHFEVMNSLYTKEPFLEFEFFISDMSPDILKPLKEAAFMDGHSDKKKDIIHAMANATINDLVNRELFQIRDEEIAVEAFVDVFSAWYDAEIQDRPFEQQTWHLPRSQFTDATIKPQP